MTSPHDDNYNATATDSADDSQMDASSHPADYAVADEGRELFALPAEADGEPAPGRLLRDERERRGLSLDEVSTRLRLPQRVIATLESDDFARIEHDVYLRGYLSSYARLLGLPLQAFDDRVRERKAAPPALVATGRISHSRYLFQRYSVPTVYVILTGLIVAPAVWLATHGGLDQNLARVSSLEQSLPLEAPAATTMAATPAPAATAATSSPAAVPMVSAGTEAPHAAAELPLMASMVPALKHEAEAAPPAPAAPALPAGSYEISLKFKDASWVELIGADGQRVEFGLLPAGSSKTYTVSQPVSVRLGNSANAELAVNGKAVDLTPYRRAAVAHLKLVDGNATTPGDN